MPRLTDKHYLEARSWVTELWEADSYRFSGLRPAEQWALHDFFDPSTVSTPEAALLFRRQQTKLQPSLPQRAGRALKELRYQIEHDVILERQHYYPGKGRQRPRVLSVTALVRTEPDYALLARTALRLAEQLQHADGEADGASTSSRSEHAA